MKFIGIIPARYSSSRFPGKPLAILGGKAVIEHVYKQVSSVMEDVFVATDDQRIYDAVEAFGGKAIMTRSDHQSGTDRICEALDKVGGDFDVVINIQGDEPFIQRSQLETVMQCFDDPRTQIATLGKPFESMEAVENPNSPKIVLDNDVMHFISLAQSFLLYVEKKVQSGSLIFHSSNTSGFMLTVLKCYAK